MAPAFDPDSLSASQRKEFDKLNKERDERVKKVAASIFKSLFEDANNKELAYGSYDLKTGESYNEDDLREYYSDFYENDLIRPVMDGELTAAEVSYLFRLMRQPINLMKQIFDVTIERRKQNATEKAFGEIDLNDVKLTELHEYLENDKDLTKALKPEEDKEDGYLKNLWKAIKGKR